MIAQSSSINFAPPNVLQQASAEVTKSKGVPEISVVIPVYKSEGSLRELIARLKSSLSAAVADWEIIFVDDRSPDSCWEIISEAAAKDSRVRGVRLSRNFGQHAAISAGLTAARGNWIVAMDADLQEPPEKIKELYEAAIKGSDIVFARRVGRKDPLREMLSKLYFKLLNVFSQTNFQADYGTFSIISKQVKDEYVRFNDENRHYLFILYWLGFEKSSIDYEHLPRKNGKSSYTPAKLIRHALQGVFFQSTVLLEGITIIGIALSVLGTFSATALTIAYFMHGAQPGWTSIAVLLLIVGGVNICALGVVGLYVGQVFQQVKGRPTFVVSSELNKPLQERDA